MIDENAENAENAATNAPEGTVDKPIKDAPPQRGIPKQRFDAVLAERSALKDQLEKLQAAEADRQRAEAEAQGKWQELATKRDQRARELEAKLEATRRQVAMADLGITDPDVRDLAVLRYQKHGEGQPFDEFIKADLDGGALARFVKPAEPEKPTGTRTGGTAEPEIPAECVAEAERHRMPPEVWYEKVWRPRQERNK